MNQRVTEGGKGSRDPHMSEDLALDLLHGLLPTAERDKVLSHLAICPACEAAFRKMVTERERLRATRVLRTLRGGDLVVEPVSEREKSSVGLAERLAGLWGGFLKSMRRPRLRLVPVAVVALLLVILLRPGPDTSLLHPLPAASEDTHFRASAAASSAAASSEELEAGLDAYAAEDFKRAVELLESTTTSGSLETLRKIYLGSALAWNGRYHEAVTVLEGVAEPVLPDPWGGEARWTLYVSLRKTGRGARADSLLKILAGEPGEVGERARSLQAEQ